MPKSNESQICLAIRSGLTIQWTCNGAFATVPEDPLAKWKLDENAIRLLSEFGSPRTVAGLASRLKTSTAASSRAIATLLKHGILVEVSELNPASHVEMEVLKQRVWESTETYADIWANSPEFKPIFEGAAKYTMTTPPMAFAFYQALKYVSASSIHGCVVECGVSQGGSMAIAAATLASLGEQDRRLHLFDTFDGSWPDSLNDDGFIGSSESLRARPAGKLYDPQKLTPAAVIGLLLSRGYDEVNIDAHVGPVQQTLPLWEPEPIAVLRLDTDFYESTALELESLYPHLAPGGVLIVDDYGKHRGATRAVDEYFAGKEEKVLLNRIGIQGRIAVKR